MQFKVINLGNKKNFRWNSEVMEEEGQNSNERVLLRDDCESLVSYKLKNCKWILGALSNVTKDVIMCG